MFMPSPMQPPQGAPTAPHGVVVPFPQGGQAGIGAGPGPVIDAKVEYLDDGGMEIDLDQSDSAPSLAEMAHDVNLAEHLPERILNGIAEDLLEGIDADIESNAEMAKIYEDGVKLLGLRPENRDQIFDGACGDFHPVLMQAVLRAQAEMRAEMLPPGGPVKTQIVGDDDGDDEIQANRKQTFMNYYLTEIDEGYYPDFDSMLLLICLHGSMFRKVYTDPLKRRPMSRSMTPQQLIVAYNTTSLDGCGRVTQIDLYATAEVIRMQIKKIWRDIQLVDPTEDDGLGVRARDRSEGRSRSSIIGDDRHTIYECHADIDIDHPGVAHVDDKGRETGLPLPFIATIDRDSRKILRLVRNWEPQDQNFDRAEYFVHFLLCPGLGFYGWGYLHFMGSSAATATKMRRQIIDAFTLGNFPGGFMADSAKGTDDNSTTIGPCEFRRIDTGGQDIRAVIMGLPYKDVSAAAPGILAEVVTAAEKVGGTTEIAIGDGNQNAPVGTTLALIDRAFKPTTAQLTRMHTARKKELRLLAKLFAKEPTARYPYKVEGKKGVALASDFEDVSDIVPVSDPNNPTQTQRLTQAQAELTLATSAPPGTHDVRAAYENIYKVMGKSQEQINKLMPPQQQAQPMDPVSEFQAAMAGKPLKAGPDQAHAAHIAAHMAQLQIPGVAKSPAAPALIAHIGEHVGMEYRNTIAAQLGQPLPPPGQPIPPQIEQQIAMMVAKVAQPVTQQMMQLAGDQPGGDPAAHEANQIKREQIAQDKIEGERKAAEMAQQNQVELIKFKHTLDDNEKDRRARLAEGRQKLQIEHIKAVAGLQQARITAKTDQLGAIAGIMSGMHDLAGERVRQQGGIRIQNAVVAAERVKGHHAVQTARFNAAKQRPAT